VEATSKDTVDAATQEVTQILLTRHKISNPTLADFQIRSQASITAAATQTTSVLTILLGAVAAISLFVGGIGIMNIMLVTVTERTREIGIRKAIGARKRDILGQFLVESMLLAGLGGLLGVGVGIFGSPKLPKFLPGQFSNIIPVVQPDSVVLAFGVSVGIGLFFGIYPANRAASLHPIEALRYE
jgi:putative ABC transport system permease protein